MISRLLKIISAKVYERILPPIFTIINLPASYNHLAGHQATCKLFTPSHIYKFSCSFFDSTSVTKQKEQENRQVFLSLFIKLFLYNKPP